IHISKQTNISIWCISLVLRRFKGDLRDTHFPCASHIKCRLDAFGKSRGQWPETNEESDIRSPVPAPVIVVDTMIPIKLMDVELLLLDDVVVTHHDPGKGSHQAGVS